ncbi:hypothetical protein ABZT04_09885 [Streptomyces sp. NPDC005492]
MARAPSPYFGFVAATAAPGEGHKRRHPDDEQDNRVSAHISCHR